MSQNNDLDPDDMDKNEERGVENASEHCPENAKPDELKATGKESSGEKDLQIVSHQCTMCNKVFANNYRLKRHAKVHQNQAEAICGICNTSVKCKYNMKKHLSKCLEENMEEIDEKKMKEVYPEFCTNLERWKKNPDLDISSFPLPAGYKMDEMGIVSGFDIGLINKIKVLPGPILK